MCVVSMVGDFYRDTWKPNPWYHGPAVVGGATGGTIVLGSDIKREEFDELKRQVLEMKELLKRAKAYDEANNEPDCEIDEKMDLLRRVASAVGVNLDDVIKPKG
jgi:hypothetical protein